MQNLNNKKNLEMNKKFYARHLTEPIDFHAATVFLREKSNAGLY